MKFLVALLGASLAAAAAMAPADAAPRRASPPKGLIVIDGVGRLPFVEVGVMPPKGGFITLRAQDMHCPGVVVEGDRVTIDPALAAGYQSDGQRLRSVAAFSQRGTYQVLVAGDLEARQRVAPLREVSFKNTRRRKDDSVAECSKR